jgi:hypothetical protein
MQYLWTRKDVYCVSLNRTTKRFYVDFITGSRTQNRRTNVLYGLEYLTAWSIRNDAVLIALKNRNYLYISSKIIHFTLEAGDMVVRFLPSVGNTTSALITRFNTIFFTENVEIFYLIDKTTSRPPELNLGYKIDEEFTTKYAMLYHPFAAMHNGDGMYNLIRDNV